jgi:ATP-dependent exoDNAse (exonuclease V) beta subunit
MQREDLGRAERPAVTAAAIAAYRRLVTLAQQHRDAGGDVLVPTEGGRDTALFEVPFTMRLGESIVRGMMDCVMVHDERRVTVLEFKTGSRRDGHRAQAELYKKAAEALFPDAAVTARIIYADEAIPS